MWLTTLRFDSLVAGTLAEVIYGHKVTSADDAHVELVDRVVHMSEQFGSLTATLFDLFPFCTFSHLRSLFSIFFID